MSDDYEVGITLALDDDVSVGVAAIQRDLLRLDHAITQSAAGLAQLRALASVALADADADVRRAAGLTAAPAPRAAARPTAEAPLDEAPAAPALMRAEPASRIAVAAASAEPAPAPAPVSRGAKSETEFASGMTPVVPVAALPLATAPAASTDEPAQREVIAAPAGSRAPPVVVEVERARPASTAAAASATPVAPASSSAPLAFRPDVSTVPAAPSGGLAAEPAAPSTLAPSSVPSLAQPAPPIVAPGPVIAVPAPLPPMPPPQRPAAPVLPAERVTRRNVPRMPELAAIGRSVMPSRSADAQPAAAWDAATAQPWPGEDAASRSGPGLAVRTRSEDVSDSRAPVMPLDGPRHSDRRNQAMATLMPAANAPAAAAASTREQPVMSGDVILDGQKVGRWMSDRMTRDVGRPPNGPTGFDPSRSPAWPGATVA